MLEVEEHADAGGAVAVADSVFGPEVRPVGFPGLGVEAAMGGDAAEEGEGLGVGGAVAELSDDEI